MQYPLRPSLNVVHSINTFCWCFRGFPQRPMLLCSTPVIFSVNLPHALSHSSMLHMNPLPLLTIIFFSLLDFTSSPLFTSPSYTSPLHTIINLSKPYVISYRYNSASSPYFTSPHLTSPLLTTIHLSLLYLTSPDYISAFLVKMFLCSQYIIFFYHFYLSSPKFSLLTIPHSSSPYFISSGNTSPLLFIIHLSTHHALHSLTIQQILWPQFTSPHNTSPILATIHLSSPSFTSPNHTSFHYDSPLLAILRLS